MKSLYNYTSKILIIGLVFAFAAPVVFAEPLTDGMDAVHVLGKPDFVSDSPTTASATNTSVVTSIAYDTDHERLFVVDQGNSRVLVFDTSSGITDGMEAVHVLGQTTMSGSIGGTTQNTFLRPQVVAYDPNHDYLFVVDQGANRVLVFDVSTITDGENAIKVLGQENFTDSASATTQDGMDSPYGAAYDSRSDTLFVADQQNQRVLVFDLSAGITDGMDASHVLGQDDFTTDIEPEVASAANLSTPEGIGFDSDNHLLFVSNSNPFHRISIFDTTVIGDGEDAIHVLGQPDFISEGGGLDDSSVDYPQQIAWDAENKRLFVADSNNVRILVFDLSDGITDGMAAEHVLGQGDFESQETHYGGESVSDGRGGFTVLPSAQGFTTFIRSVAWDPENELLFAGDGGDNRVVVFDLFESNSAPTDIDLSSATIAEDQTTGSTVGILSATDADEGDTATFTLACTAPGADDASFSIIGSSLKTATALDFETKASYDICVRVTDSADNTFDKDFTITITDVDETVPEEETPRSGGSSGGGVALRCRDPQATNFSTAAGRSDASRCQYAASVTSTPTPPSSQNTCPADMAPLQGHLTKMGDKGIAVLTLQKTLNCKMTAGLAEDSIFGRMTDAATRAFQFSRNINVDGVVGPITLSELQK